MHKLMIKTHNVTGLKYLCYTQKTDHVAYKGSGKYWKKHLRDHGDDISTELIFEAEDYDVFVEFARRMSVELDVVKNSSWANLKLEEGDGGNTVSTKIWITDGIADKYIECTETIPEGWVRGRTNCKFRDSKFQSEMGRRGSESQTSEIRKKAAAKATATKKERNSFPDILGENNPAKRNDVRQKIKQAALNRPMVQCPHCGKQGQSSPGMFRFHFDKCGFK